MAQEARTPSESLHATDGLTGVVFDVKRYAIHDGPGIRTTVFLKGCPLRCTWCHNPESWATRPQRSWRTDRCSACGLCVEACPRGAISMNGDGPANDVSKCDLCGSCAVVCPTGALEMVGRNVSVAELAEQIDRDVVFFDQSGGGVTFSGGEPLWQQEFLLAMLQTCKQREIHTVLDTSLHAPWEVVESMRPYVDLYLVDLKHMDAAKHEQSTGVSNTLILENLRRLARLDRPIIIRVPVVPGINDDDANVAATGRFAASLGVVRRVDVLPYHGMAQEKVARLGTDLPLLQADFPSSKRIAAIVAQLEQFGFDVRMGG